MLKTLAAAMTQAFETSPSASVTEGEAAVQRAAALSDRWTCMRSGTWCVVNFWSTSRDNEPQIVAKRVAQKPAS
jgi:hypothetical protein